MFKNSFINNSKCKTWYLTISIKENKHQFSVELGNFHSLIAVWTKSYSSRKVVKNLELNRYDDD